MESDLGVREAADQLPGIDLGDGNIKTSRGTIRVPKSSLKKQKEVEPINTRIKSQCNNQEEVTTPVIIHTDFGDITYDCLDVVKTSSYLILEMRHDNFAPKSYIEAPDLRLPLSWEGNVGNFIFTGCKWKQKRTGITFVILLEVEE